jgi:hypothetical protein
LSGSGTRHVHGFAGKRAEVAILLTAASARPEAVALEGMCTAVTRIETDAPTPEQISIAAAVVRLADRASSTGLRIHAREMTPGDWQALSDAYGAVSAYAQAQLRTAEGVAMPAEGRLPRLSEIVWAQGVNRPMDVHWVIVWGRTHQADPYDRVARLALCGASAVPVRIFGGFTKLCDTCRERLRDIHQEIGEELAVRCRY